MIKFVLGLILITQVGCSFVVTTAGSFLGNLGADLVEEKMEEMEDADIYQEQEFMGKCLTENYL